LEYKNLLVEKKGSLATVTVSRPKALNALNTEVIAELYDVWRNLESDTNIGVVIITGDGEKSFVAGADIGELNKLDSLEGIKLAERGQGLYWKIENSDIISIAAINGFALGGGCELAMACDIRIASKNVKIGQPEVNLGIIPGYGGTQRLARLVGKGMAKLLILTGDMIDAEEALRIGLVDKITEPAELLSEAEKLAGKILSRGPKAVISAKRCINFAANSDLDTGLRYEIIEFGAICATDDSKEGTSAFMEKRKPNFKGA